MRKHLILMLLAATNRLSIASKILDSGPGN
jgi:hypothetical protein